MMAILADCKCDNLMAVKYPLYRLLFRYNNGMTLACAALGCGNQLLESAAKDAAGIEISNSLGDISRASICNGCLGPWACCYSSRRVVPCMHEQLSYA